MFSTQTGTFSCTFSVFVHNCSLLGRKHLRLNLRVAEEKDGRCLPGGNLLQLVYDCFRSDTQPWNSGAAQPRRHSAKSLSRGTLDLESINCNDSVGSEGESEAKLTASVLHPIQIHPYHCLFVSYPSLLLEKGVCTEHLCTFRIVLLQ